MREFLTGQVISIPIQKTHWSALQCMQISLCVLIDHSLACGGFLQVLQGQAVVHEQPVATPGEMAFALETTPTPLELAQGEMQLSVRVAPVTYRTYRSESGSLYQFRVQLIAANMLAFEQTRKGLFLQSQKPVAPVVDCIPEIHEEILAHVGQRKPYSLIRLGDGEGRILASDKLFNVHEILRDCIGYQYGRSVFGLMRQAFPVLPFNQGVDVLRQAVVSSIYTADRIGVPSGSWFGGKGELAPISQAACHYARCFLQESRSIDLTRCPDTHFLRYVDQKAFFGPLIARAHRVFLLTSFDVAGGFERHFQRRLDGVFTVPGHQTFSGRSEPQFPFSYRQLIPQFAGIRSGDLVLVGAGYLGKLYCAVIKHQGAVALDIGSLFDAWAGHGRPEAISDPTLRLSSPKNTP